MTQHLAPESEIFFSVLPTCLLFVRYTTGFINMGKSLFFAGEPLPAPGGDFERRLLRRCRRPSEVHLPRRGGREAGQAAELPPDCGAAQDQGTGGAEPQRAPDCCIWTRRRRAAAAATATANSHCGSQERGKNKIIKANGTQTHLFFHSRRNLRRYHASQPPCSQRRRRPRQWLRPPPPPPRPTTRSSTSISRRRPRLQRPPPAPPPSLLSRLPSPSRSLWSQLQFRRRPRSRPTGAALDSSAAASPASLNTSLGHPRRLSSSNNNNNNSSSSKSHQLQRRYQQPRGGRQHRPK